MLLVVETPAERQRQDPLTATKWTRLLLLGVCVGTLLPNKGAARLHGAAPGFATTTCRVASAGAASTALPAPIWYPSLQLGPGGTVTVVGNRPSFPETADPLVRQLSSGSHFAGVSMAPGHAPTQIPPPPRGFYFALPRAAVDRHGVLHVLWGEGPRERPYERSSPVDDTPLGLSEVWYAQYVGRRWSAPQRVSDWPALDWRGGASATLWRLKDNLLFAAPGRDAAGDAGVLVLRRDGGRWRQHTVQRGIAAAYVDMAALENGTVVIATVSVDPAKEWDRNSLFVVTSPDGGVTWQGRELIASGATAPIHSPRLVVSGERIELLWLQGDSVRLASRNRQTGQWMQHAGLPAEGASEFRAIAVCDDVLVLLQQSDHRGWPRVRGAKWQDERWVSWLAVPDDATARHAAALGATPAGDVAAVWTDLALSSADNRVLGAAGHLRVWRVAESAEQRVGRERGQRSGR